MPKLTAAARADFCRIKMRGDAIGESWPLGEITQLDAKGHSFVERFLPIARPGTELARGYIRVSTVDQLKEGSSIETQKKKIIDYCRENELTLFTFYYDLGISGACGFDERPAVDLIFRESQPNENVVVTEMDRLGRIAGFVTEFDRILMERCVEVRYVYGMDRLFGKDRIMYLGLKSTIANYEKVAISDRSLVVTKELMAKGLWRERPHFGWMIDPNNRTGPHVPDPHKFQIVSFIRDQCKANPRITQRMIARALEKKFNPTDFNILLWTNIRISAIIAYPPNDIDHEDKERWYEDAQRRRQKKQAKSRAKREEKEQGTVHMMERTRKRR